MSAVIFKFLEIATVADRRYRNISRKARENFTRLG